jgi:hypothetical protein
MTGLDLLAPGEGRVLNVRTAEVLDLATASIDDLADAREALVQLDYDRRGAAAMLDAEIVRRTDEAIRTGEIGAYTYETPQGYRVEVVTPAAARRLDASGLRADLLERVRSGQLGLTTAAVVAAFKERTSYTLARARFNTLKRQLPELAAIEELHAVDDRRRVAVTRPKPTPSIDSTAEEAA